MTRSRTTKAPLAVPSKVKRSYRRQRRASAQDALRHEREPERDRRSDAWNFW